MASKKFYAYFIPGTGEKGVVGNWALCEKKVKGIENARFKSFSAEESGRKWIDDGAEYSKREVFERGIYFDAGTGGGKGVAIRVTDEAGKNLLHLVLPKSKITRDGKHYMFDDSSNNYGELLASYYAIQIAMKTGEKKVFGDSKLILNYWSKGFIGKDIPPDTRNLIEAVKKLRNEFEDQGGSLNHISGDWNPSDLGFH